MERVNLRKGEKVNLTKRSPISKLVVGLGWAVNAGRGANFDLDASAFLLTSNERVTNNSDLVFYGGRFHPSGAVNHMGDNLTGSSGNADDEQIKLDLDRVPQHISKIVFVVTIYDAEARGQNFGQVSSAFIRIFDEVNYQEILRYDLAERFYRETGVICGELNRYGSEWEFNAIGRGFNGGLEKLCRDYGVNV
ncbi:MAG: TerD family protein [Synergistaceae bacterium]|nr:TerD family protein [Synergistaceae bacterium]